MLGKSKLLNGLAVLPALVLAGALLFAACRGTADEEPAEDEGGSYGAEQPETKGVPAGSSGGHVSSGTGGAAPAYAVSVAVTGNEAGDSVTFSPKTGKAGAGITIGYTVANVKGSNELFFSGTAVPIAGVAAVGGPESGTRTYTVNASDAVGGAITITAKFTHTDLTLDAIEFDPAGPVAVEYGDGGNTLTKAVKPPPAYLGSGAISYTSSDPAVATVAPGGVVTILKAGWTDITASKAADPTYASSTAYYRLEVGKKTLTIGGVTATNRAYDGTDTVVLAGGTLSGFLSGETVGFALGSGTVASADASAAAKAVTTGITLTGAHAGNYTLTQPTDVTVVISKAAGAAVGVPAVSGTPTDSSITVNTVTIPSNPGSQTVEYAISEASDGTGLSLWQGGVTFTGLSASTTYYVYARSAESTNYDAGTPEDSGGITTDVASGFTVTFNSTGGSSVSNITGVTSGSTITAPTPPTKTDNSFSGWCMDADLVSSWDFATDTVTANTTLYARWISKTVPEMVKVNAGSFTMGSGDSQDAFASPAHSVTLTNDFYISRYPVTQAQYEYGMGSGTNPSYFDGSSGRSPDAGESQENRPVEQVSWYDAIVFCNMLSMKEGLTPVYSISGSTNPSAWGTVPTSTNPIWNAAIMDTSANGYRLPTEAEWEYTCRAGTTSAWSYGTTEDGAYMWYSSNSGSKTHEVGQKLANPWGLYDMYGNVFEWCWDWFDDVNWNYSRSFDTTSTLTATGDEDPAGVSSGAVRIVRGGNWINAAPYARSAFRFGGSPDGRVNDLGFRVVRRP